MSAASCSCGSPSGASSLGCVVSRSKTARMLPRHAFPAGRHAPATRHCFTLSRPLVPVLSTGSPASTPVPSTLDRRLGPLDGAAVVVSNVIGGGIFLVPAFVAQGVPHPWRCSRSGWRAARWRSPGRWPMRSWLRCVHEPGRVCVSARGVRTAHGVSHRVDLVRRGVRRCHRRQRGRAGQLPQPVLSVAGDTTPLVTLPLGPLDLVVSPQAIVAVRGDSPCCRECTSSVSVRAGSSRISWPG